MPVIRFIYYVFLSAVGFTGLLWLNLPLIFMFSCLLLCVFVKKIWLRLIAVVLSILAIPFILDSAHNRMAAWDKQIRGEGPGSLSILDNLAIYTGNIWMAAGGLCVGAFEASAETLLLAIPNRSGMREANWVFFDGDPSVISTVRMLAVEIEAKQANRVEKKIKWPPGVYSYSNYRVSLALAGGSVVLERNATSGEIISYVETPVTYPPNSYLTLIDNTYIKFTIPERIFWALEQNGWFHPFVMRYYFNIKIEDSGIILADVS